MDCGAPKLHTLEFLAPLLGFLPVSWGRHPSLWSRATFRRVPLLLYEAGMLGTVAQRDSYLSTKPQFADEVANPNSQHTVQAQETRDRKGFKG